MLLTLLNPLDVAGTYPALSALSVAALGDHYTDRALQTSLLFLSAAGVLRLSHVNDQPVGTWGLVLDTARRPDADTLDQYLRALQSQDGRLHPGPVGQVGPGGVIAQAQSQAMTGWAQADLFEDPIWYFDGHTIEYTGQARIGKTLHGTKHFSVKAVDEYCLFNHIPGLTCYFPTSVTYEQALRQMLLQAQAALPADRQICKLAFDKEGWNAGLIKWLVDKNIILLTWVKDTTTNRALLANVDQQAWVDVDAVVTVGKSGQEHRVVCVADVDLAFPDLGTWRVVVLETDAGTRIGIFTNALRPADGPLDDERVMSTLAVLNAMHHKQRIENSFKVRGHEMDSNALPTHQVQEVVQTEPYDLAKAQAQAAQAEKRLARYASDHTQHAELLASGALAPSEFKILTARTTRLQTQTQHLQDRMAQDLACVKTDDTTGQTVIERKHQVLDVHKLTLLNLFKDHALVVLHLLAHLLGLDGAGPARLRREILAHGDRIEFDPGCKVMTVYAKPFPRARSQLAYEHLCAQLNERPVTFVRDGRTYRVRFSW